MQTIHLLTTGGTIEKAYSEQSGAVLNNASKIGQYLKMLRLPDCEVRVIPLMNKDSLEMTEEDRAGLVLEMTKLLPQNHPIVITHGTDTMVETGLYIERAFPALNVPVILTGAMAPLGFEGSDGLQNLTESLLAARLMGAGIFVVIHGQVFSVGHVRKDRERGTFVGT
jgi:L-asparaginase